MQVAFGHWCFLFTNFTRNVGAKINLRRGDDLTLYCQFPSGDVWEDLNVAL